MPPRDRLGWSLVRRPLQQVDIEGLRGGALDPGGHAVGIRGVERIPAATRPDPDPASGGGLARFVVDELEAPGTGHAVAVKGKGGSGWGGREDVADEYRPRAADHPRCRAPRYYPASPPAGRRKRRQESLGRWGCCQPWHWAGRWIACAVLASVRCAGRSGGQFGIERVGTYRLRKKRRRGLSLSRLSASVSSPARRTVARCAGQP